MPLLPGTTDDFQRAMKMREVQQKGRESNADEMRAVAKEIRTLLSMFNILNPEEMPRGIRAVVDKLEENVVMLRAWVDAKREEIEGRDGADGEDTD